MPQPASSSGRAAAVRSATGKRKRAARRRAQQAPAPPAAEPPRGPGHRTQGKGKPPKKRRKKPAAAAEKQSPAGGGVGAPPEGADEEFGPAWFDGYAKSAQLRRYMHTEWGRPKRGDRALFEKLCLEGAQAGWAHGQRAAYQEGGRLSWATVLAKREAYRRDFHGFDLAACAAMTSADEARLLQPPERPPSATIVRNRAKVASVPANARAALALISEAKAAGLEAPDHGYLDQYLWSFVGGRPELNRRPAGAKCPAVSPASQAMSKGLKAQGFKFCGPTICYSLMQSCGMVIDHPIDSPQWKQAKEKLESWPDWPDL